MRTTALTLSLTASLLTATALAQDAYAAAPAANASMTTILPPANCTSGCTTIVEPCSETSTPVYRSGGMPPVTGSATYNMPSGPSATGGDAGAPPAYTGAAAAVQVGGLLIVSAAGMLPRLV